MTIILDPQQVSALENYRDAHNFPAAYRLLAQWAGDGGDTKAQLWFEGAAMINENAGPFATLTYEYTRLQGTLRGLSLTGVRAPFPDARTTAPRRRRGAVCDAGSGRAG